MTTDHAILKTLEKIGKELWFYRNHLPILNFPIPWRLPYGCWFLIYPDEMGLNLLPFRRSYSYEEGEWRFLSMFIKPGMVCFDIGANQGFYTILLSRCVGTQGRIFAFEPVWIEFRKLKWNILINRLSSNLVLEKMAIGFQEGVTDIIVCLDGHGSRSSMRKPPEEVKARTKVEKVPITTLDSYVRNNNVKHIDFIKIDVEGAERDVLKGGIEILTTLCPVLMVEMADVATQQFGHLAVENYKYLENYGFVWFEVTPNGFLKAAKLKNTYRENLIAVPREKLHQISDHMEAPGC